MRSPSVFNFYRPGYVPPGTEAATAGLAVPEMQLAQETTAAGYVNYMRDNISSGVGAYNGNDQRRGAEPARPAARLHAPSCARRQQPRRWSTGSTTG